MALMKRKKIINHREHGGTPRITEKRREKYLFYHRGTETQRKRKIPFFTTKDTKNTEKERKRAF